MVFIGPELGTYRTLNIWQDSDDSPADCIKWLLYFEEHFINTNKLKDTLGLSSFSISNLYTEKKSLLSHPIH